MLGEVVVTEKEHEGAWDAGVISLLIDENTSSYTYVLLPMVYFT